MYGVGGVPFMSPSDYARYVNGGMMGQVPQMAGMGMTPSANVNQNRMLPPQILKGRPVSGVEEARASMIDLDGSMFIFPDIANQMIYTKQINLNGEPEFKTYALVEQPKQEKQTEQNKDYVLRRDFEDSIGILVDKIKELEGQINVRTYGNDGSKPSPKKPVISTGNADGTGKDA